MYVIGRNADWQVGDDRNIYRADPNDALAIANDMANYALGQEVYIHEISTVPYWKGSAASVVTGEMLNGSSPQV